MYDWLKKVVVCVEPLEDSIYGPRFRCSLTLIVGTHLPCAVIQSRGRLVDLAKQRINEVAGRGQLGGANLYGEVVSAFVAGGNRINDYDVASAAESRFAIPLALLSQIQGETSMGWTGWVFRMRDGRHFSYGSSFHTEFFQLPDGYEFADVEEVINHSFVDRDGTVTSLKSVASSSRAVRSDAVLRERVFFTCVVDGV
jgi:hypothetical protein